MLVFLLLITAVIARPWVNWDDDISRQGYNMEVFNLRKSFFKKDPSGQFAVLGDDVDKQFHDIAHLKFCVESAFAGHSTNQDAISRLEQQNFDMEKVTLQQEKKLKEIAGKLLYNQMNIEEVKMDYQPKQTLLKTLIDKANNHERRIAKLERQLKNRNISVQRQLHDLKKSQENWTVLQVIISYLQFLGLGYVLGVFYQRILKRIAKKQHFSSKV